MVMIQLVRQARTLLCLDRNIPVRDAFFFFFLTVCLWGVIWVRLRSLDDCCKASVVSKNCSWT